MNIRVATFNILAPCWASVDFYPQNTAPFLDRLARRNAITKVLKRLANENDFIALQETQKGEIEYFEHVLESVGFEGYNVTHEDTYWQSYVRPDVKFSPNGVALYWNVNSVSLGQNK